MVLEPVVLPSVRSTSVAEAGGLDGSLDPLDRRLSGMLKDIDCVSRLEWSLTKLASNFFVTDRPDSVLLDVDDVNPDAY